MKNTTAIKALLDERGVCVCVCHSCVHAKDNYADYTKMQARLENAITDF